MKMLRFISLFSFFLVIACGSGPLDAVTFSNPSIQTVSGGGGVMSVSITQTRTTGVSPVTVWYRADVTDSSVTTPFTDARCSWNFGDSGSSGTGAWSYGNPTVNSMNTDTGQVAAHTYVVADGAGDTNFTASVSCADVSGNTTSGNASQVTVYDASGANGFPTTATTCFSTSGTFTNCPSGANQVTSSSFDTAFSTYLGSNKRVLFRCGETFTGNSGDSGNVSGTNVRIGAYGSCVGTTSGLPILSDSTGTNLQGQIVIVNTSSDVAISDIECDGNSFSNAGNCIQNVTGASVNSNVPSQVTILNVYSFNNHVAFWWSQGAQWAVVNSRVNSTQNIGTYVNFAENNPTVAACSGSTPMTCLDYQAVIGSSLNGAALVGGGGNGEETMRVSAGRYMVISHNLIQNSNTLGALLKIHNGNTYNTSPTWTGEYTEYLVVNYNQFGNHTTTSNNGAQLVEFAPQNGGVDERLRYGVFEGNFFDARVPGPGRQILVSAQNVALRDNIFWLYDALYGVQVAQRGNYPAWPTQYVYLYNNTFYGTNLGTGDAGIGFSASNQYAAGNNSIAKNNLCFFNGAYSCVLDSGTGNTVSNNTATATSNPSFTNGSSDVYSATDFKPTANYSGGTSVPCI